VRRLRRLLPLLIAGAVLAPVAAAALSLPPLTFVPASRANYAPGKRSASAVRVVVVHVTEGTSAGAISWFRNPRARASANYVVGRDGAITQMVRDRDVAWHAGNGWFNRHSLGVEHEGYTGVAGMVTDAEYRASAQLVAALLARSHLPVDRRHVIGHNEVPDPAHPWLRGGFSHHTDPGRYWDWARYLTYVRSYARGVVPPPPVFDVTTTGLTLGQSVAGAVEFEATPAGEAADHIEFRLDGRTVETLRTPPFALAGGAWDTTLVANGGHTLTAHAVAPDGRVADASVRVTVANPAVKVPDAGLSAGQVVFGTVRWAPKVTGAPARVELLVDGAVRATLTQRPYAIDWDTTHETDGPHALLVRALRSDGKLLASRAVAVTVANAPQP
jgi:N-acetylmuramoyl-L-alanine amidase-like protein